MNKMLKVLSFFLLICKLKAYPMEMVVDIVNSFDTAVFVKAYFCNKFDSVNFIKTLSRNYVIGNVYETSLDVSYSLRDDTLFLLDLKCGNSSNILTKADEMKLFSSPYKWLLLQDQNNNYFTENISTFNILTGSEMIIAQFSSKNVYKLKKIYNKIADAPTDVYEIGIWKQNTGLILNRIHKLTARNRNNLFGTVLKVCIVVTDNDSLNHLTDRRDSHKDTITKVNYILVQHLGSMINASLQYSVQNTWGYQDNKSQWSGMIGELQRQEADIGGTPLFVTSDRVPVIDYIAMTSPSRSYFVFRQPKLSYVSNVYILPFHWTVWISLLFLIILTSAGLYVTTKWDSNKNETLENYSSWLDVTLLTFGAMCQQGSSFIPFSVSGRIITVLMFITLMFLYTSYSANIVALLQSPSNSIQSLNDLLHSRLDLGVDDTVFNHFYFPNTLEPVRRAIYVQKVAPPGQKPKFMSMDEGVKKLRHEHFAFHMETGVGYKIVLETFEEHEKCGLQEIQFIQVSEPWLAIQKKSPYKEMLKIGLRKLHESGIQAREYYMLYTKKPACTNRGSSFVSVGIIDCYMATAVLLGGISLALITFILEKVIKPTK